VNGCAFEHGEFESSHGICPNFGCDSKHVTQEFRTPVQIRSGAMKRFDAGIKQSSQMYGINNFRSAREGEAAFGGDAGKKAGMEVLWGDKEVSKTMGVGMAQLIQKAHVPLTVRGHTLTRNNALREAATEAGITRRRLPRAGEVAGAIDTPKAQAQALTV
jgi:hypothetical protein